MTFGFKSQEIFSVERDPYLFAIQCFAFMADFIGTNLFYIKILDPTKFKTTLWVAIVTAYAYKMLVLGAAWILTRNRTKKIEKSDSSNVVHAVGVICHRNIDSLYWYHSIQVFIEFGLLFAQYWLIDFISEPEVWVCCTICVVQMGCALAKVFVKISPKSNQEDNNY